MAQKVLRVHDRNAVGASDYFQIPPKRVAELGTQVELYGAVRFMVW